MDRIPPSEGGDAGSIPAERTNDAGHDLSTGSASALRWGRGILQQQNICDQIVLCVNNPLGGVIKRA